MLKAARILILSFIAIVMASVVVSAQVGQPRVMVLEAKGVINPVLADYIKRGIDRAEDAGAVACVIQMDTPGGLDTSMRDIIQNIVDARIPIVVYVSPPGARAASAGVFITISAHVAAMSPNTVIGAASPVSIGPEGEEQISETMREKIVNDAAAYIRSLAEAKGRNMEWAEKAVREAVSATETEALDLNVIDLISPDINTLLSDINGREITLLGGARVTLNTAGAAIEYLEMNWMEDFLYAISDPNIAFILMSLAILGITAEIFNPGLIFPGVVGAISLLLAFFSLGTLPVNWAGILLIVLAFGLFIAEIFTASFGLLTAGGITSLVIGALILFRSGTPGFRIDPAVIATVTIIIAGFFTFALTYVIKAHRRQAFTGREELIGKTAVVRTALEPEGMVFFKGENWKAVADKGRIKPGEEVVITGMDGLVLNVSRKTANTKEENE